MRHYQHILHQYRTVGSYTGLILLLAGLLMLTPLVVLLAWPSEVSCSVDFLIPGLLLALIGAGLWRRLKTEQPVVLTVQAGGIIVVLSWVSVCIVSAIPLARILNLTFTQAMFESVSGWTTTGLSVVDVTQAPHIALLWRSIMQLAGGAGFAIIMLAAITGPIGPGLSLAEGRTDQLVPHVRQSAKLVLYIYLGYVLAGIIAYWVCGMSFFDAVNHTFAAVSTGGFSTHSESIGYWNSVAIELVSLPLMLFGNLNFLSAYLLLQKKYSAFFRNGEVRVMAALIPIGILLTFWFVTLGLYTSIAKSLRVAVFEVVSALTTTGFSTVSYHDWNDFGVFMLIVLMLIGGGTCSTAGGIKQFRVYVLFKMILWEIQSQILPQTAVVEHHIWQGEEKRFVNDRFLRTIAAFVFLYLVTIFIGTGIIAAHGYSLKESLFEYASSLGTVGLSVGVTSAAAPPLILWTQIIGMLLGRLEFFVIFVSIIKLFKESCWMKNKLVREKKFRATF